MKNVTVGEFIVETQNTFPGSSGELSKILSAIKLASKIVSHHINKAGLAKDILGSAGRDNVQGEDQQKLDVFANDTFINALNRIRRLILLNMTLFHTNRFRNLHHFPHINRPIPQFFKGIMRNLTLVIENRRS